MSRITFGGLLRQHRLAAGLTQEALAERAGLSRRGISDLERGARQLPLAQAMPYPHGEGRLLEVYSRLHLARGESAAARARLEQAVAIFRQLGARKDIEQTEQLLATHLHPHE